MNEISNVTSLGARAVALSERARDWMLDRSFPFWAKHSPSPEGGFFERLDLNGYGIPGEDSRVRLQARMAFTFALAADCGWDKEQALELTERALDVLITDCRRPDGLYGRRVQPGHGLTDDTAECYDTAFALLAFATAYKVFGLEKALLGGIELSNAIDEHLRLPSDQGGYRESLPAPKIRAQNPHMHLTEASLAWYKATEDQFALRRAKDIVTFIKDRFVRDDTGLLLEFDGVPDSENRVEVGHMFEWVWILGQLREFPGTDPEPLMSTLHDGGMRLLEGLNYVPLSQSVNGDIIDPIQRTWGPTEKLKGHIAYWRINPSEELAATIVKTAEDMFADHVDENLQGSWIDVITPNRDPKIKDITPATGYHIFLALQEYRSFAAQFAAIKR